MFRSMKSGLLGCASLATVAFAAPALAQEPIETRVDEIIVTVQKREQSVLDVPAAVTAFDGDFLRDLGVEDFADAAVFIPGFEVQDQSPNNPGFVIRGITSDDGASYIEPRISVFQDGVSISKARGSFVELFDLERIEVAKGPQSTLFGRGALIGAVNLIQNRADLSATDYLWRVGVGDYEYGLVEGMANLPLTDTFAVRLAGRYRTRDGYVDNLLGGDNFNSVDTAALRLAARWQPTADLTFDLIANWQEDNPSGTSFRSIAYSPTNPTTGAVLGGRDPWDGASLSAGAGFPDGTDLGLERTVSGVTLLTSYDLSPSFTLNAITAYREFEGIEIVDGDGISLPVLTFSEDARGEQFSQEFRLNFDDGGRISWFVGAGYFHEEGSRRTPAQFDERMALAQLTGALDGNPFAVGTTPLPAAAFNDTAFTGQLVQGLVAALSNGNVLLTSGQAQALAANLRANHLETATDSSELTSFDLFGDVTLEVTDRLELGLGLRWTTDEKTSGFSSDVLAAERSVLGGIIGAAGLAADGSLAGIGQANAILGALQAPNAAFIPQSVGYPVPNFGLTFQPTAGGATVTEDLEDDGFTWRLTALYDLNPSTNLYANYARGRTPEVLSAGSPALPGGAPSFSRVDAETVDSYEIGIKGVLADLNIRYDVALFFYDYQNFRTIEQQGTLFVTTNAGEASAYGIEIQEFWSPTDTLDVFFTYGYNRARFETGIFDGNSFRLSPDHTVALGGSWRVPLFGGELDVRPTYTWQSEVFFDDNNDIPALQQPPRALVADNIQDETQDAYGVFNLRLSYAMDNQPWEVELFANNLFDEEYLKDAGNTGDGLGLPTFISGEPRTVGVIFTLRSF